MKYNVTRTRRKAEKRCIVCGRQDESTLAGHLRCTECAVKDAQYGKRIYHIRKNDGVCASCGAQDERTRSGKTYCAKCAAARNAAYRRWALKKKGAYAHDQPDS